MSNNVKINLYLRANRSVRTFNTFGSLAPADRPKETHFISM